MILAVWFVTDKIVEPRLYATMPIDNKPEDDSNVNVAAITKEENKAYYLTVGVLALMLLGLFALCYPDNSVLRAPDGTLTSPKSPVIGGRKITKDEKPS